MDWLRENWFWLAVVVLFLWMHKEMHGAHGGHGGHGGTGGHRGHSGGCGGHGGGRDDEEGGSTHAQH